MTKLWNRLRNRWYLTTRNRTNEKNWQSYYNDTPDYTWLKKTVVALGIFAMIYGAHVSDTRIGQEVTGAVRQMLTTQTDFVYYSVKTVDYINAYWPNAIQLSEIPVLKQVKATVSRPADPLMYMTKPVEGQVMAGYGWQTNPGLKQDTLHEGIDIAAQAGTSVRAAAPGSVKIVTDSAQFGKVLIIDHGQGIETFYGHLADVLVKDGDAVSQGQVVGRVGKTGAAAPVLYFELRENGKAIDPLPRMKSESVK
ncbi:M23 family metallopeptidase [Sporomusa sp.]|jgi:murein DD-endopeptidase MepM/ murein hydrolase activator NlpD|uniref:M23 family metallopeptidase n=1 Tax=Sporomusa sp. TaxID=2078658 RepID=UPI002B76FACB|nr:M23 family metallopeptidase [Sporomusa sp.]MDF2874157.1 Peptidase family [Sporomusa sp.]HWR05670.1 M23 family metallopeptidase [Sporomusa sp.]